MPRAVLYDPFRVYLCFTLWTIEVVERHRNYKTLNSTHTDPHRATNYISLLKSSRHQRCTLSVARGRCIRWPWVKSRHDRHEHQRFIIFITHGHYTAVAMG